MAESFEFGRSKEKISDNVPEHYSYCEPCYEGSDKIKPVVGYCQNCYESLCRKCYIRHLRRKLFKDHMLVDKSTEPKTKSRQQTKPQNLSEECLLHNGEKVQSFCHGHSMLCCKVCLTIDHRVCNTENISKLARNIQGSQELQNLIEKFNTLLKGFNYNLSKTVANEMIIKKNHRNAMKEMKKIQDEFDKMMIETKAQAEKVKEEDFDKTEMVAATCDIVIEQIYKLTTNLDTLKDKGKNERLFISMKHAESWLKSLEENREKIDQENVVSEYKFKPDARLITILKDLKVLGQLLFEKSENARILPPIKTISVSDQPLWPMHLKDITVSSISNTTVYGSLVHQNNKILITDFCNGKLKLIDTNQDKIISEKNVSARLLDITKVKENEFAVTLFMTGAIQFISVSQNILSKGKTISVNCSTKLFKGIAYNDKNQTLIIVADDNPGKIILTNLAGSVIRCLQRDSKGYNLFEYPHFVALSPDMTEMYVTDSEKHTVTLLTMNGIVKAVYRDKSLRSPYGVCVNKLGLVFVVGYNSHTALQLDPVSGTFNTSSRQEGWFRKSSEHQLQ